jgi:hypothetical protein
VKSVKNLTGLPLRITLPGGKVLHLGPRKTAGITAAAVDHHTVKDLIKAKKIEILDDDEHPDGLGPGGSRHADTHGHLPRNKSHGGGDR